MRRADVAAGAVLAVVGVGALVMGLNMGFFSDGGPGAGFFPTLLSCALVVLGVLLAVSGLRPQQVEVRAIGEISAVERGATTTSTTTTRSTTTGTAGSTNGAATVTSTTDSPPETDSPPTDGEAVRTLRGLMSRPVAVWLVFVGAAIVMPFLGFVLTMMLLLLVVLYGIERKRGFLPLIAVVLVPVLLYELFVDLLAIQLPVSMLDIGVLSI